jgi:hypothetical protein
MDRGVMFTAVVSKVHELLETSSKPIHRLHHHNIHGTGGYVGPEPIEGGSLDVFTPGNTRILIESDLVPVGICSVLGDLLLCSDTGAIFGCNGYSEVSCAYNKMRSVVNHNCRLTRKTRMDLRVGSSRRPSDF